MKWAVAIGVLVVLVVAIALAKHFWQGVTKETADEWPPEIKARAQAVQGRRSQVKAQYPELFARLSECLFRHDPIGINFETNTDEYDPEVGTIIPRLPNCSSESDVLNVVHDEFVRWFGADVTGPKAKYAELSAEVWTIWSETQPNVARDGNMPRR